MEASELVLELLGLSPERNLSISVGRAFGFSPYGYHPGNFRPAKALWWALHETFVMANSPVGHDHELMSDLDGDLVLFGGANSTVLTGRAFEYQGTEFHYQRPEDRNEEPVIGLAYYCVEDECLVEEDALIEETPLRMAGPNWPIRGTKLVAPNRQGLYYPPLGEERLLMSGQRPVGAVIGDYLLVTRLPNVISHQLPPLVTANKSSAEWPQLVLVAGSHGVGTRAFELLLRNESLPLLRKIRDRIGDRTAFQMLFAVKDLSLDIDGYRHANDLQLIDVATLDHSPEKYYANYERTWREIAQFGLEEQDEGAGDEAAFRQRGLCFNGSSSGMWNRRVVPDSLLEEEPTMQDYVSSHGNGDLSRASANEVVRQLNVLNRRVTTAQKPIRDDLQAILNELAGCSFGSLEANQRVANELQFLMLRLDVRVRCPQRGCREPATIRCKAGGRTRDGSFAFDHRLNGKMTTHSAVTRLPKLKLVAAPRDPRRKRKSAVRR